MRRRVAAVDQFEDSDRVVVEIGQESVLVLRLEDGFVAVQNRCTHEKWPLQDAECKDGVIECDLHGAQYCVRTGAAKRYPARTPLRTYPVHVEGSDVYLDLAPDAPSEKVGDGA